MMASAAEATRVATVDADRTASPGYDFSAFLQRIQQTKARPNVRVELPMQQSRAPSTIPIPEPPSVVAVSKKRKRSPSVHEEPAAADTSMMTDVTVSPSKHRKRKKKRLDDGECDWLPRTSV
jgi:hypothetical protein